MTISFHRLEEYELREHGPRVERAVICSFDTVRFGYLQVGYDKKGVFEIRQEPDLEMLRDGDRKYVKRVMPIVWRMVFDAPAATERFE